MLSFVSEVEAKKNIVIVRKVAEEEEEKVEEVEENSEDCVYTGVCNFENLFCKLFSEKHALLIRK